MPTNERSEDLNPRNKDIEEKVKQMLDPSLPDEPPQNTSGAIKSSKIRIIDSSGSDSGEPDDHTTAPELPTDTSAPKERKVIVPISHDDTDIPSEKKIDVTDHGESPEELEQELNKVIAGLDTKDQPDTASAAGDTPPLNDDELVDIDDTEDEEPIASAAPEDGDETDDITDDELKEAVDAIEDEPGEEATEPEVTDEPTDTLPPEPVKKQVTTEKVITEKTEKKAPAKPKKQITVSEDIDDPAVDKAVKDIVKKESDDIPNETSDKALKTIQSDKKKKHFRISKKFIIWSLILILLAGMAFLIAAPNYRYKALNALGVRASSSVVIKDATTGQPLPNATVRLGETTATTNQDGYAELGNLYLGDSKLVIEKVAFASIDEPLTIGWGSNPLGDRSLTPTGVQFTLSIKDVVSGGPVASATASRGDSSANADENGLIKLTIPNTVENQVVITLSAEGYKTLELKNPTAKTDIGDITMVSSQKHTYVAPDYTILISYIDGSEEKVLLEPSGFETDDLVLIQQPNSSHSAYISTRTNNRNDQGNLTYNLLMLDSADNTTKNIALADQIIPHGWIGGQFVFTVVSSSDESAEKSKLQVYNSANGAVDTLAVSNYFNDVHIADGSIFFAPSGVVEGGTPAKLYRVKPDGSDQKTIFDDEVWKLFRNSYEQLAVSAQDEWYQYNLPAKTLTPLETNPDNTRQMSYVNAPSDNKAAVITNDGILEVYSPDTRKSDTLVDDQIVQYPIYWFNNDTVVYRTTIDGVLTAVAVSITTKNRVELSRVAEIANNDNWYFY